MFNAKYILDKNAARILHFWFCKENSSKWFYEDYVFDNLIKANFLELYLSAKNGILDDWIDIPEECLALLLLLSQFPRNIFKNTYECLETDEDSIIIARHAIKYKYDYKLRNKSHRLFLYLPFMRSELLSDQNISVNKIASISKDLYKEALFYKNIIEKFGRFPQRNKILNRISTEEELDFLSANKLAI